MPHTVWSMIATTPWWIYLVFFCAIRISFLITKPRVLNIKPFYMASLPLFVFAILACYFLPPSKQAWLISLPLLMGGSLFGFIRSKWHGIKAIANKPQLLFPGSKFMFIIVVGLFIARQYFAFYSSRSVFDWMQAYGHDILLPLYAFSIGIILSQLFYFRHLIQYGPYATQDDLKGTT